MLLYLWLDPTEYEQVMIVSKPRWLHSQIFVSESIVWDELKLHFAIG